MRVSHITVRWLRLCQCVSVGCTWFTAFIGKYPQVLSTPLSELLEQGRRGGGAYSPHPLVDVAIHKRIVLNTSVNSFQFPWHFNIREKGEC